MKIIANILNGDILMSSQIAKPENVIEALIMNDNISNIVSAAKGITSILPPRITLTRIIVNTTNVKQTHINSCSDILYTSLIFIH